MRILVVDDDPWILRMVSSTLVKYPRYRVDTARDGKLALERLAIAPVSLVVADIMMPNMDGWSLAKAIRESPDPKLASIPLLFLSALGPDPEKLAALGLDESHHLCKPFRFQELEAKIADCLERSLSSSAARVPATPATPPPPPPTAPAPAPSANALDGYLEQLSLSSLLVMMEMERKDGILSLQLDATINEGKVYLREGRVVSATINGKDISPKDAIYSMLTWNKGRFSFEATSVELDDEVQISTTGLLMESARMVDEAAREA